jgi:hypothetical protein
MVQVIDLATSLAKVADVDRNLGTEKAAVEGFEEAIMCLEKLKLDSEQASLEQRVTRTYPFRPFLPAFMCPGLTFDLRFFSGVQFSTSCRNSWMTSKMVPHDCRALLLCIWCLACSTRAL